ncbi:MAG: GNAT family N-acetyltransferase [Alphaproteobacteria bacterium]|nr:GNAT family N-acetyltransferase [Alphaproteobacteria bacterium]
MAITRRPATDDDKAYLKRLGEDQLRDVVVAQFGAWDDHLYRRCFEERWRKQTYQIVEMDGRRVGALWATREADHIWLRQIFIETSYQNQGIGTAMLRELMDEAGAAGLPLRLRVLTANRAKALYERLGFETTGMHADSHYWMDYTP